LYREKVILVLGTSQKRSINRLIEYGFQVNLASTRCWSEECFDDFIRAENADTSRKTGKKYMTAKEILFDAVIGLWLGCLVIPFDVAQTTNNTK
jgi:hypothetical protein